MRIANCGVSVRASRVGGGDSRDWVCCLGLEGGLQREKREQHDGREEKKSQTWIRV